MEELKVLLENILKRQITLESKFVFLNRKVDDVKILQRRNTEKLMGGLKACQKAFLMGCEQQIEMREELSCFAGDCIDHECGVRLVV